MQIKCTVFEEKAPTLMAYIYERRQMGRIDINTESRLKELFSTYGRYYIVRGRHN